MQNFTDRYVEDFEKGTVVSDKEPIIVRENESTALVEGKPFSGYKEILKYDMKQ